MLILSIIVFVLWAILIAFVVQALSARKHLIGETSTPAFIYLLNTIRDLTWSHFKFILFNNHKRMGAELNSAKMEEVLKDFMRMINTYDDRIRTPTYELIYQLRTLGFSDNDIRTTICTRYRENVLASDKCLKLLEHIDDGIA